MTNRHLVTLVDSSVDVFCVLQSKRRALEVSECSSETLFTSLLADRLRSAGAGLATCAATPKYKRDPSIRVDNENIGQHPRDRTIMIE